MAPLALDSPDGLVKASTTLIPFQPLVSRDPSVVRLPCERSVVACSLCKARSGGETRHWDEDFHACRSKIQNSRIDFKAMPASEDESDAPGDITRCLRDWRGGDEEALSPLTGNGSSSVTGMRRMSAQAGRIAGPAGRLWS
jgi:hypothetical protein